MFDRPSNEELIEVLNQDIRETACEIARLQRHLKGAAEVKLELITQVATSEAVTLDFEIDEIQGEGGLPTGDLYPFDG